MTNLVRKMQRNDPFHPIPKRRWKRGEFMGRTMQERRDGDLLTYLHPTKGWRSRRWPAYLPHRVPRTTMAAYAAEAMRRVANAFRFLMKKRHEEKLRERLSAEP
jgi:hypothetical protein